MSPLNRLNLLNPLNLLSPLNPLSLRDLLDLRNLPGLLRLLGLMGPAMPPSSLSAERVAGDARVTCVRRDRRAAGYPVEVDRERRELGDHTARRPRLETVEDFGGETM